MPFDNSSLISIIMGVRYTRESTFPLERSVHSILDQTYQTFELLISDDGSTPAAQTLLERMTAEDCRIRLLRGCLRLDLAAKLNFCLAGARGTYIARMDDDDKSYPERLERQIAFLQEHPDIAFVGSSVDLERDGQPAGVRNLPEAPEARDFRFTQPFIHPSLLFRREALDAAGGYCESADCIGCEDYDLLLRLYHLGFRGWNIRQPLLLYTLPGTGSRRLPMKVRCNEVKTRYSRFREMGFLPRYFPYVVKPVIVGLIPNAQLRRLKGIYYSNDGLQTKRLPLPWRRRARGK